MQPSQALAAEPQRSRREVLQALSGLLLAMFVAILSSTIVSNALPTIVGDLHGSQTEYTWVVTATLLATTVSTPIWGKLSDLFSKKLLVQLAIIIFVGGSVAAGFSTTMTTLIAFRVVQGLGAGGLQALAQVVIAAIIPPRERGRYSGYLGGVLGVATVAGPLVGGLIVDTSWLGWRWCFFVGVPIGLIALAVLQKTLHVPTLKREVRIDYMGAALLTGGVSVLLVWTSLAGTTFAWGSTPSIVMAVLGVVALGLFVLVERRAAEPILPLWLFRERTVVLAVLASLVTGLVMFGGAVFLGQYFQISRGFSPTSAGLLTLPLIGGLLVSSAVSGQLISRFGRWKPYLVAGTVLTTVGLALLATIDHTTAIPLMGVYLGVLGVGVGMTMQNLVLAVQNTVDIRDVGAASSTVSFLRSLGGTVGVTVLGVVLADRVASLVTAQTGAPAGLDDIGTAPPAVAQAVMAAYGDGIGTIFLIGAIASVLSIAAVVFIREVPLRTTIGKVDPAADQAPAPPRDASPSLVKAGGGDAAARDGAGPDGPVLNGAVLNGAVTNGAVTNGAALNGSGSNGAGPAGAGSDGMAGEPAGPAIVGTVRRTDGAALPGAVVTVTDPAAGRQVATAVTGADGGYRSALEHGGTFLVVVASGAMHPQAAMVAVADRAVRHDVGLTGGSGVRGVVRSSTAHDGGRPEPGVALTLLDVAGDVAATAVSGPDGRFHVAGVGAGRYTLATAAAHLAPVAQTLVLPDGGEVEHVVELPSRARLVGTVTAGGRGVAEALATLVDANGTVVGSEVTDRDGMVVFEDLAAGGYTLTARGYAPTVTVVRVAAGTPAQADVVLAAPVAHRAEPASTGR